MFVVHATYVMGPGAAEREQDWVDLDEELFRMAGRRSDYSLLVTDSGEDDMVRTHYWVFEKFQDAKFACKIINYHPRIHAEMREKITKKRRDGQCP